MTGTARDTAAAETSTGDARTANTRNSLDPRVILASIGEAVYRWDLADDAIAWGINAAEVLGIPDMGPLAAGRLYAEAVEPGSGTPRHEALEAGRDDGTGVPYRVRYALRLGPNRLVTVEDNGRWFADAAGRAAYAHGAIRIERVTDGEVVEALRTRSLFLKQTGPDVAEAVRAGRSLGVLVAAIEDLDTLNEEFGYETTDAVIDEVARRIGTSMRRRDRFGHYAGNRFALTLQSCPADQAEVAARRLVQTVQDRPVETPVGPVWPRLKVGGACAPDHAVDAPTLLRRAEEALAAAKHETGTTFVLYRPGGYRGRAEPERGTPVFDIVAALNERRLICARQPVVDARTGAVIFKETLVRIRGTDGNILSAGDILPAMERAGLVSLIDMRMLELAADHLARNPLDRLSINVSPSTLEGADWLGTLAAHLGARRGIAERLIVEVTETAAVRDPEALCARLDAMKALGIAVAIDDFGAGHTSFRHLRRFPVDILKIDGVFVQNLARSPDDRFFVRTLVDLAHHLGIATVAEWVEDEASARLLAEWGVDFLQGDHCGAPEMDGVAEVRRVVGIP